MTCLLSPYSIDIKEHSRSTNVFILYGDLKDFSVLSEKTMVEETAIRSMESFYHLVVNKIHDAEGILLCFMGDGFLCAWNEGVEANIIKKTIYAITTGVAGIITSWLDDTYRLSEKSKKEFGIRFGGSMAKTTFFTNNDNVVMHAFGNQLNHAARLQQDKKVKANMICLTDVACTRLGIDISNMSPMQIRVKKQTLQAFFIPVARLFV